MVEELIPLRTARSPSEKLEYLSNVWGLLQGQSQNLYVFANDTIAAFIQSIGLNIPTTKMIVEMSAGLDYTGRTTKSSLSKTDSLRSLAIGNNRFYDTVELIEKFGNFVNNKISNENKGKSYINLDFPVRWY